MRRNSKKQKSKTAMRFRDSDLRDSFVELIRKTSAELPDDVVEVIAENKVREESASRGRYAMDIITKNIELAKLKSAPLCQDTGSILFFVHYPRSFDHKKIEKQVISAVKIATKKGFLRQNSVDSITGANSGNNIGPGTPTIHFEPWSKDTFDARLILKGGGCENVGAQYSLPDTRLGAGRDLDGVRKCILDAVVQAQGKGCGPGVLAVTVGGDRATGYLSTKELFLEPLRKKNKDSRLAALEEQTLTQANQLGIGPMGFGGKTTLMDIKIRALNRLPASFFVSISYMCWAYRRQGAIFDGSGKIKKWIY